MSKKVLIMPSPLESSHEGVSHDHTLSGVNRGSDGDLQLQIGYLLAEIRESLGELHNAAKVSDDARKINDERTLQLLERITKAETMLTDVNETVDHHRIDLKEQGTGYTKDVNELGRRLERDVNELGRRLERDVKELGIRLEKEIGDLKNIAHTAKTLGYIFLTLISVIFTYLYLRFSK